MKVNNKRTPVTIVIAVVCGDSIVVASDSQVSQSVTSTSKRMDGKKIYEVSFTDAKALVATSGNLTFGQRAVEAIQRDCEGRPLSDYRQLAECAARHTGEANRFILSRYAGVTLSKEDIDRTLLDNNFSLLTAHYFTKNGKTAPHIYVVESPKQSPDKMENYAAIGCGAGVAEFLISWFDFSKMASREAAVTAAFIVGEAKKFDCYCGGPTQVSIVFPQARQIMRLPDESLSMIEAAVEAASRRYKSYWGKSMSKAIREISQKV